ncbi:MAG: hypothetical protein AAB470_02555 [Patescibacteria group bacterium]
MRKIISFIFHKNFDKSFVRLDGDIKKAFRERRNLLLIDSNHPILDIHPLHGKWKNSWSMNITGDIRAIFKLEGYIAIFWDIGTHSQLYG